jgi:hypothetical protein
LEEEFKYWIYRISGDSGRIESVAAAPSIPSCGFVPFSVKGVKDISTLFSGFVVPTESIGTSAENSEQKRSQKKKKKSSA